MAIVLQRPLVVSFGLVAGIALLYISLKKRRGDRLLPPKVDISPWQVKDRITRPDVVSFYHELRHQTKSPVYRLGLPFGIDLYVVQDAQLAQQILIKQSNDKPHFIYETVDTVMCGQPNLVSLPTKSPQWKVNRKAVNPAFAPSVLNSKVNVLHQKLEELYAILDTYVTSGAACDICKLFFDITLDYLFLASFDYDLKALKSGSGSEAEQFSHELDTTLGELLLRQGTNPLRRWKFWDPEVRRGKQACQWLKEFTMNVLTQYRSKHTPDFIAQDASIIAHLIRNTAYPHELARAGDLLTFAIGGHDTTANTLSWTLFELSHHPDIQEALQAELDMCPDSITPKQAAELDLLNRCLKESMRLWPVFGTGSFRQMGEDLQVGDMVIPKGAIIVVPYGSVFRPLWLKDTDEFVPDRWVNPSAELEALSFPFSVGARNCVGQNMAMLQMRVVLAGVLKRFSFSLAKTPTHTHHVTSKPEGLQVFVKRREVLKR